MPTLSDTWEAVLHRNFAHFPLLNNQQQKRLLKQIPKFISDKFWQGCAGLTMTDEIRVTIAAQVCLMLLGLSHDYFSRVRTVLVYPSAFMMPEEAKEPEDELDEGDGFIVRQGETHSFGPVILAWDSVLKEARNPRLGQNVVIHEFAHQLDMLDGDFDGTPDLHGEAARKWKAMLDGEFSQLQKAVRQGHATFLGDYAASNKSEFFAVASERFFTLPHELKHHHPELFELLRSGYVVDTREWFASWLNTQ